MIKDYMRKDLVNFKPYHSPKKDYDVKIDANENPYGHSPKVISRLTEWLSDKDHLTRYPDTDANVLRDQLSQLHQIDKDQIICTVGSDQLIELIIKVFVEPGDAVMVPNPSFSMYTLSTVLNHGKAVPYELDDQFDYDYNKIIEKYKIYQPKLLFICTPNNPTGNKASIEGMKQVLDQVSCPVIIDEAYEEFVGKDSMTQFIEEYPNLIVLRTFSKAYGLAGVRIGYGMADKEVIDMIGIAKPPYNVSAFSQTAASLVLSEIDYYQEQAKKVMLSKDELMNKLSACKLFDKVYKSTANFVLVKVIESIDAQKLSEYLEQEKLLVRDYGKGTRLEGHLRITVGTEVENKKLLELCDDYDKKLL